MNDISRIEASKVTWQDVSITAGFLTALVTAVAVYIIISCNLNNYDAAFFAHPGTICVFVGWGACLATTAIGSVMCVLYGREEAAARKAAASTPPPAGLPVDVSPAEPLPAAAPAPREAPAVVVLSPAPQVGGQPPRAVPPPPPPPPLPPGARSAANGPGYLQPPHAAAGAVGAVAAVANAKAAENVALDLHAAVATPFLNEVRDLMVEWLEACYRMCWSQKVKEQAPKDEIGLVTGKEYGLFDKAPPMTVVEARKHALVNLFNAEFRDKMANTFLTAATTLSDNQKCIMYVYLPHTYIPDPKDHYTAFVGLQGKITRVKALPKSALGPVAQSMCEQLKGFLGAFLGVTKKKEPMANVQHRAPPVNDLLNGAGLFKAAGGLLDTLALEPHNEGFSVGFKTRLGLADTFGLLGTKEEVRVAKLTFQALMSQYHAAFTTKFPKFRAAFNQLVVTHIEQGLIPALTHLEQSKGDKMTFDEVIGVFREHCRAMSNGFKALR